MGRAPSVGSRDRSARRSTSSDKFRDGLRLIRTPEYKIRRLRPSPRSPQGSGNRRCGPRSTSLTMAFRSWSSRLSECTSATAGPIAGNAAGRHNNGFSRLSGLRGIHRKNLHQGKPRPEGDLVKPMNTDSVHLPLTEPDSVPSHIRDLHVSHFRDGNDACTHSKGPVCGRTAGRRRRSHPLHRKRRTT